MTHAVRIYATFYKDLYFAGPTIHFLRACNGNENKYHPKVVHMQWKVPGSAIIIGSTIKLGTACMRLAWNVVQWPPGVLCYLYELVTLFLLTFYVKNQNRNLWRAYHAQGGDVGPGVGLMQEGRFDLVH
jgi:hypothetical protein